MQNLRTIIIILSMLSLSVLAQTPKLSLEQCLDIALKNNSDIITNKNLNESAEKGVLGSYSGILPTVGASAGYSKSEYGSVEVERDVPIEFDPVTFEPTKYERRVITQPGYTTKFHSSGVTLNQNIFDGGNWWFMIKQAKSEKTASDYSYKSVENMVILNVQQYFFDLLKQQKLLEVYELAVQRSKDQLDKTQKMFDLGAVAKVDVYRSKVNLGNDQIQYLSQKNAVISAKNNLNVAMGREPETNFEIEPEFVLKERYTSADQFIEKAIKDNPGLKKVKQDIKSQQYAVNRSQSTFYPQLSGSVGYYRGNEVFDNVWSNFDKNWNLNYRVGLSINLFNGFRDKVNIQQNKLYLKNTKENLIASERNLKSLIIQLIDNYNSYLEIIDINKENLEAAQEEYRLEEERYRIGSSTQLEVREAQVNLTRAEQTLVAAQYNARITQAQLEEKLGHQLSN